MPGVSVSEADYIFFLLRFSIQKNVEGGDVGIEAISVKAINISRVEWYQRTLRRNSIVETQPGPM